MRVSLLQSGGGKHELPDTEGYAGRGRFWFFDDADRPEAGHHMRLTEDLVQKN
jgi:hypothetical protein